MASDATKPEVTRTACCGPSSARCKCNCPESCEHKWDGPAEDFDGGLGWTATCSRCGTTALSHDLWVMP